MQRDGATTSLWQQDVPDYEAKQTTLPQTLFDVVIAGGGITGLTTALLLQKSGKRCLLVEAKTIGFGTTSGTTAHINTLIDTGYAQIEKDFGKDAAKGVANATKEACELIKENVRSYNIDCGYAEKKGFLFSQNKEQDEELDEIIKATQEAGVQADESGHIPVPIPFTRAMQVEGQAQFHSTRYILALAKEFEAAGGVIVLNCRVQNWHDKETVTIETTLGEVEGKALVLATHVSLGVNLLHLRCAPYRSYAIAVELEEDNYPDDLAYDMYDPYRYYRTQNVDGKNYLIAGGEDHKTAHEDNTEVPFLRLEAYVKEHFKVKNIAYKWSSQYYEPVDGLPYIGHMVGSPNGNVYVATGFSGNGITYGTVSAIVLNDLINKKESPYKDLFSPNRIKPVAGFTEFAKENLDVAKEFVKGFFAKEKIETVSALAHGEGKVVSYEGEKIALYKDEAGGLHAVNPTCPHLKCSVKWNIAEKSWDCPCHGARYTFDGNVITGPAGHDLKKIDLEEVMEK